MERQSFPGTVCAFTVGVIDRHCLQGEKNDWNSFLPHDELSVVRFLFAWLFTLWFGLSDFHATCVVSWSPAAATGCWQWALGGPSDHMRLLWLKQQSFWTGPIIGDWQISWEIFDWISSSQVWSSTTKFEFCVLLADLVGVDSRWIWLLILNTY